LQNVETAAIRWRAPRAVAAVLDRHVRVDTMLVEQVNPVGAQAL
jgi:hypothetical protein